MSLTDDVTGGSGGSDGSGGEKPSPPGLVLPSGMASDVREILVRRGKRLFDELGTTSGKEKVSNKELLDAYSAAEKRQKVPDPVPMDKGTGKTAKGVPTEVSKVGAKRAIKKVSTDQGMVSAGGVTYKGKWMGEGLASGPRPKVADRDLQLLHQLSVLLYDAVSATTKTEEIESMAVNWRVVVSANEEAAVAQIRNVKLQQLLADVASGKIGDIASALPAKSGSDLSDRQRSGMGRLAALETDSAQFPGQVESVKAILETLHETMAAQTEIIDGGSPGKVARLITDPGAKNRVITVNAWGGSSGPCSHAEQNLLYALVLSGHKGPASIAGKKRPCTVCWISLMLVRKAGYGITFSIRPGGFWDGTTYQGLQRIAARLGFTDEGSLAAQVKALAGEDSGFKQYVTSVLGTDPETSPVLLLKALKDPSHYVTDRSTPDRSPTYDFPPTPPRRPPAPGIAITYAGLAVGVKTAPEPPTGRELTLTKTVRTIGTDIESDVVLGNETAADHAADVWLDGTQAKLKLLNGTDTTVTQKGSQAPGATGKVYDLAIGDTFQIGPYVWAVKKSGA